MGKEMQLANADSKVYWESASQGKLVMQKCTACHHVQFPPRHICAACWSDEIEWAECSGAGEIESFTIVRRAPVKALRDKVPYVVASIKLAEGPRMITNLIGDNALEVSIGDVVNVDFAANDDGVVLPQFRRA